MSSYGEVIFWDVKHGHSTYVKSPNGKHMVVDLGVGSYSSRDETFSPLLHLKNNWDVQQLNYVVITHPHKDHIDDILNFDELNPKILLRPSHLSERDILADVKEEDKPLFEKYLEINQRYNQPIADSHPDNTKYPDNYGGMEIKTFSPKSCDTKNFNNHSIVTIISYAGIKIVIPGDNETCSFNELLEIDDFKNVIKNAYVLLAPHHGRESGYHQDFMDLVNPSLTVISDSDVCDSSANQRYSQKSTGWKVHSRNGEAEKRYCVTTNSDGVIHIKFGYNDDKSTFLYVEVD